LGLGQLGGERFLGLAVFGVLRLNSLFLHLVELGSPRGLFKPRLRNTAGD
jgi:hypothetical protein